MKPLLSIKKYTHVHANGQCGLVIMEKIAKSTPAINDTIIIPILTRLLGAFSSSFFTGYSSSLLKKSRAMSQDHSLQLHRKTFMNVVDG
jgi:hypothetical protein